MTEGALDLTGMAAEYAARLDDVTITTEGDVTTFSRGEAAFGRTSPGVFDVCLPADIADAALRTPGTSTIEGDGWIRFATAGQEHVLDRAQAWFQTGWRHAAGE